MAFILEDGIEFIRVACGKKSKSPLLVSPEELANEPTGIVLDDRFDIKEYLDEFHQKDED